MVRVDLGCGKLKEKGCIGLDVSKNVRPDIVADLTSSIPLKTSCVDEAHCNHFLEHTDFMPVIEQIHRIMKPGGIVHVTVPYYSSKDFFTYPTHKTSFTEHTFHKYFSSGGELNFYSHVRFEVLKIRFNYSGFGKFLPFKRFFRHILLNVVDSIEFDLKVIK